MAGLKSVIILFFVVQAYTDAREMDDAERYKIALVCIEQTGVQRSVVEQAMAGNIPKNNSKYKEFLACSYKKQGYQSETGEILIDNVKKFLQKSYGTSDLTQINDCASYNETTHGETAYNALQCIISQLKKMDTD